MIHAQVRGQELRIIAPVLAADTIAYLEMQFDFSEEWQGYVCWAHFEKDGTVYNVKLNDGRIQKSDGLNLSEGRWKVYVHGNLVEDGQIASRVTTEVRSLTVLPTGVTEGQPLPTVPPTAAEQILASAEQALTVANALRADADAGVFDGEKGEKGDRGEPGEKGEKGDKGDKGDRGEDGRDGADSDMTSDLAKGLFANCLRGTAEGATVSIPDAAFEGSPLQVTVSLSPVQAEGTPSPDNALPITGHQHLRLCRSGKNFIPFPYYDTDFIKNGITFTVNEDGSVHAVGTAEADVAFNIFYQSTLRLPENTVNAYLSGCPSGGGNDTYQLTLYYGDTENQSRVYEVGSGAEMSKMLADDKYLTSGITRIAIRIMGGTTVDATFKPQLEIGAAPTEYEPYRKETLTFDLGEEVFGGRFRWETGELEITHKALILDGSIGWSQKAASCFNTVLAGGKFGSQYFGEKSYCERYENTENCGAIYNGTAHGEFIVGSTYFNAKVCVLAICDTRFSTTQEWQAHLADHPVKVVYPLAEPRRLQLTPTQIKALQGTNTLSCEEGELSVTYSRDINAALSEIWQALAALTANS